MRMPNRQLALVAFDAFFLSVISFLLSLTFAPSAWAYVDPSVMTYTIQALVGVGVALSAVLGVAWRKARKRMMAAFDIDENRGKTVEAVAHRVDAASGKAETNACDGIAAKKESDAARKGALSSLSWAQRLAFSLLASLFCFGTLFFVAPFELVAGNAGDLTLDIRTIGPIMSLFSLVLIVVVAVALSFVKGRAFQVLFGLLVGVGLSCFVEALFLNAGLPSADGRVLDLAEFPLETVVSTLIWVAIVVGAAALSLRRPAVGRLVGSILCGALIAVQAIGLVGLMGSNQNREHLVATEEGLFEVSPKSNVIVFVLDTTDTSQVVESMNNDPYMVEDFAGFTFFADSVGSLIPTRFGVPFLLTGKMPQVGQTFDEYYVDRFEGSSFVKDISDAGYSVGLYTNSLENGIPFIAEYAENIHELDPDKALRSGVVDIAGTIQMMCQCALYRDLPWAVKPAFWYYTDWLNSHMVNGAAAPENPENVPYLFDDFAYGQKLENVGLSVSDRGERGAFKFIHLLGTHKPYVLDAWGNLASLNTSADAQTRGVFRIVGGYLAKLKELGLYEDATIIVTADHGEWINSTADAYWVSSPVLMVKPAGVSEGEMKVSRAQTGHVDFPATVLQAVGSQRAADYGITVWDAPEQGRKRYYCHLTHDMVAKIDYELEEFEIDGFALSFSNWKLDGNRWVITAPQ